MRQAEKATAQSTPKAARKELETKLLFGTLGNLQSQPALEHLRAPGSGPASTGRAGVRGVEDSGAIEGLYLELCWLVFPSVPPTPHRSQGFSPQLKTQIAEGTNNLEKAKASRGSTVFPECSTPLAPGPQSLSTGSRRESKIAKACCPTQRARSAIH